MKRDGEISRPSIFGMREKDLMTAYHQEDMCANGRVIRS
jgi:hypothetical protein